MYGFRFWKTLNFNERKTLESAIIFAWKLKSHCSFERWLRWFHWFLKILILKGTFPTPYFENVWCDFSALERAHGLKFRMKVFFFDAEHDDPKIFQIFENFGKSRNQFWDSP